ncbi:cation-translocating P-type ATPase [Jeotgalibaca caeni]|uniref:cation-translocating P-type ATPase n=1 Tax=Jeotgalibaca caeni TaxID=3028623 RepID=UPI00237E1C49|nr:cation-translocating P-type ATPase [Jeotgalibaca caeni]MDE1549461.1 cation-translocating P-type ATPase [Jeotgalibaca caeni]
MPEKENRLATYQKSLTKILADLSSSPQGLADQEAQARLATHGYNELQAKEKDSFVKLFLDTFKDAMVLVLLVVASIQMVMGHAVESLIIFAVLLVNSIVSVVQTRKAESSLDALKQLSAPEAKVIRNGLKTTIPARELVPGDVVLLEAGDHVPADGRLLEEGSLKVDEGMLTGESDPVEKEVMDISGAVPVGDRINMVHSGSLVVYGRGTYVVTETANDTEIGQVANLLNSAESQQTPLQRNLDHFSKRLGLGILALSVVILGIQVARIFLEGSQAVGPALLQAFMFAVAVAVAAIPEALQSIVTIVLSLGTKKMAKKNAVIRKLPAVETLGSTSIIATDKTGTLTQNKMTVVDYYLPNGSTGSFNADPATWSTDESRFVQIAVLANDASITKDGKEIGDPTEVALVSFSNQVNQSFETLRDMFQREAELPFDSDRKLMSTVHTIDGQRLMLTKGGPDVVFNRSSHILIDGEVLPLNEERLAELQNQNEAFSKRALRVLAMAYKPLKDQEELSFATEEDLIVVGLMAMIDPPREAVYDAVASAKSAGIKTLMITGDHKTTAQAIATDIGIAEEGDIALTGSELDNLSERELDLILEKVSVYARVSPENKIRIVRAWQNKGHVSAMTGDGVNDAPALKQSDIGIAMGSGTDVAKDAAAMVLTDDNFVSIVQAVEVGRNVYANIKKAVAYLFAGNLGAIIAIVFALIMNWVSPFTAIQLLFINLVNDSFPAIALGMEKGEPDVMKRKPRNPKEGIFSGETFVSVLYRGILIAAAVILAQFIGSQSSPEMGIAMAFSTLILSRTLQSFPARSNSQTAVQAGFFSNKAILWAVALSGTLYGLTLLPAVRGIFSIPGSFGWSQLLISLGLAIGAVLFMEATKLILAKKQA